MWLGKGHPLSFRRQNNITVWGNVSLNDFGGMKTIALWSHSWLNNKYCVTEMDSSSVTLANKGYIFFKYVLVVDNNYIEKGIFQLQDGFGSQY